MKKDTFSGWWIIGGLVLLYLMFHSSENEPSPSVGQSVSDVAGSTVTQEASDDEPEELDDGDHDCVVTNTTRGNGPYDLACEKNGNELTVHFNNGGYRVLDIDSSEFGAGHVTAEGTDSDGETWEVEIDQ